MISSACRDNARSQPAHNSLLVGLAQQYVQTLVSRSFSSQSSFWLGAQAGLDVSTSAPIHRVIFADALMCSSSRAWDDGLAHPGGQSHGRPSASRYAPVQPLTIYSHLRRGP